MNDSSSDIFESLVNEPRQGKIYEIACKMREVTGLRGLILDIDFKLLRLSEATILDYVNRVLPGMEIRITGGGLHCIMWLVEPIQVTEANRDKLIHLHQQLKIMFLADPAQKPILSKPRVVGSINSKYGNTVDLIQDAFHKYTLQELEDKIKEFITVQ